MAHLNPDSPFQSWILTEKELLNGTALTILQKQCIQNQIAQLSMQKNVLEFDPQNPMKFMQTEAELRGQISALQYLVTLSLEAERTLSLGSSDPVHIHTPQDA